MSHTISATIARNIAESTWGTGGTKATRTNRKGAFYYSCSSHGGFVIDESAMTQKEIDDLKPHISPIEADLYTWTRLGRTYQRLNWYGMKRGFKYSQNTVTIFPKRIYLFEEDSAWCLPYVLTGIRFMEDTKMLPEHNMDGTALKLFNHFHLNRANPITC